MLQKGPRPLAPVLEGAVVKADVRLVELLLHVAVAVDADVAPLDGPRHVEVGGHVEAGLVAPGEEVVQLVAGAVLVFGPHAVVVVDADGVVAATHKAFDEAVGHVVVGVVRGEAEVDAVEALSDAGQAFELEPPVDGAEPAVLPGWGVLKAHAGEVEGAAGNDVLAVFERDPFVAARD